MLIQIGDDRLYNADIWADIAAYTWAQLAGKTWGEIANPRSNLTKSEPAPIIHHLAEDGSTADFTVWDGNGEYHFQKGQEVVILRTETGERIFGGYIDTAEEEQVSSDGAIEHTISCIDYQGYLGLKRRVIKAWRATATHVMARWILDNILASEGVEYGEVQEGPEVEVAIFDYMTVQESMDKIGEWAGMTWLIDDNKKFYLFDRASYAAPWPLVAYANGVVEDALNGTVRVSHSNPEYRNKQYIKGGWAETSTQTESFRGDGTTQTFTVGYKISREPVITLNGVPQTVGIKGVETSKDWYWSKNDPVITQDPAGTKLTESDVLTITYIGRYAIVAVSTDYAAVADRISVEGGSGLVESVADEPLVDTQAAALERANALLAHYASIGKKISYSTRRGGLAVGQLQQVTIPRHALNHESLISETTISNDGFEDTFEVVAVSGPVEDFWTKLFLKMAEASKAASSPDDVGTADVLIILDQFNRAWEESDAPNIFKDVYPGETTLPGTANWPCFAQEDKLKYLVLYSAGSEVYRRYKTSQVIEVGEIRTTVIVPAEEANDIQFSHIALWGGDSCDDDPGSGIELSKFSYVRIKSNLESLQLDFRDLRW